MRSPRRVRGTKGFLLRLLGAVVADVAACLFQVSEVPGEGCLVVHFFESAPTNWQILHASARTIKPALAWFLTCATHACAKKSSDAHARCYANAEPYICPAGTRRSGPAPRERSQRTLSRNSVEHTRTWFSEFGLNKHVWIQFRVHGACGLFLPLRCCPLPPRHVSSEELVQLFAHTGMKEFLCRVVRVAFGLAGPAGMSCCMSTGSTSSSCLLGACLVVGPRKVAHQQHYRLHMPTLKTAVLQCAPALRVWLRNARVGARRQHPSCRRHSVRPPSAQPSTGSKEQPLVPIHASVPAAKLAEEAKIAKLQRLKCRFCKRCGGAMELAVPEGEDELRHVCYDCGFVDYHNPKMVVGCVVEHKGQVLLCRRALAPCEGRWTLPAGYMEMGETCQGARCTLLGCTWECARTCRGRAWLAAQASVHVYNRVHVTTKAQQPNQHSQLDECVLGM